MFSMQDIGKRIISLRKNKNMTQVDLADKLGISYQAVSSWERGNSMPDIAKIPEIADLFQISIDELIGESKVVNAVLNISNHGQWKCENLAEEEIKEAFPILKPDQITEVIDSIDKYKIKDIGMFLPFMREEDVKEMALEAYKTGKNIRDYLPFMNEEDVKEMALEAYKADIDIRDYLPFMNEEDVKEVALEAYKAGKDIRDYLPFMNEEDVKEIALEAYETGKDIRDYLPFMNEEDVKSLMVRYLQQ